MNTAKLRVSQAGPLVSIQDKGRFGGLRYGVSASGPMDRFAFDIARAAIGPEAGAAALEVSLGGLTLECVEGEISIAVAGGAVAVTHAGQRLEGWHVIALETGQSLSVTGGAWGSWAYLAFAGALMSQEWLGATATHSMTGFGGGMLQRGQVLEIENARLVPSRHGSFDPPASYQKAKEIRVTMGPQDRYFPDAALETFADTEWTISPAYDRMGMRLSGPKLGLAGALSIPSEPIMRGSIQVSGDGVPTVLLADHGTTGGYPKIATVIDEDQDRLVQLRAGEPVRFKAVSAEDAVAIARDEAKTRATYLDTLAQPRISLEARLMQENLVGGVIKGDEG